MREGEKRRVPSVTVPRLALYLRKLRELRGRGVTRVSSRDLAQLIDLNPAQIRKDFSYFGEFGTRGVGYEVDRLIDEITHSLGLDRDWNLVIVGAGLLGTALARYRGFTEQGFKLIGMFDVSDKVIGASYGSGRVKSVAELEDFCAANQVDIAIVAVPPADAQATVDRLVVAGIRAILNFAPVKVSVRKGVTVRQVDLSSELMFLSYSLASGAAGGDETA